MGFFAILIRFTWTLVHCQSVGKSRRMICVFLFMVALSISPLVSSQKIKCGIGTKNYGVINVEKGKLYGYRTQKGRSFIRVEKCVVAYQPDGVSCSKSIS